MPFGKYKDRNISTIPRKYLRWFVENIKDKPYLVKEFKKILEGQPTLKEKEIFKAFHPNRNVLSKRKLQKFNHNKGILY